MTCPTTNTENPRYVVGLDMGSYSVGMAAFEIDDDHVPVALLSAVSHIHDGGVDPTGAEHKNTRRAVVGM